MAASSYDEALKRVLVHEGGYTNHPSDPGGPTNFGITIADYRQYLNPKGTAADVRAMQLADAEIIYRQHYWDAVRGDDLPAGVDYCIFDYGVNSGISRAAKVLQRIVRATVDGVIGNQTLAHVKDVDPASLIGRVCDKRLAFLKQLRTWPIFGKGWGTRVRNVRTAATAMAKSAP